MTRVPPALSVALAALVPALRRHCAEPWCLIGSAAACLLGAAVEPVDIDVLVTRADAATLIARWAGRRDSAWTPADDDRFRSCFARFEFPGLPVEVMGGLQVRQGSGWQPVVPGRLVTVDVDGVMVPVPALEEQIRLLEAFDRDKDHRRIAALRRVCAPTRSPP